MKKLVAFVLAVAILASLGISAFADNAGLTEEEARQAALEYAQVREEDARFTKTRRDWDDGRTVYEIEFWVENTEYEMDVDTETGRITDFSVKEHAGRGFETRAAKETSGEITKDEALEKAYARAGVTEKEVDFVKKVERDFEHGREVYEIEFYSNGMEYNVEVEIASGKIVSFEKDRD